MELRKYLLRLTPSFYDVLAGALFGGGIQIAVTALEEASTKDIMITIIRFLGVCVICGAGVSLIKIGRIVNEVEDTYGSEEYDLIAVMVNNKKSTGEIKVNLEHRRDNIASGVEAEEGALVPTFIHALALTLIGGGLFFISGLSSNYISEQIMNVVRFIFCITRWCP